MVRLFCLAVALAIRRLGIVKRVNKPLSPSLIHVSGDKPFVSRRRRPVPGRLLTLVATRRLVRQQLMAGSGAVKASHSGQGHCLAPTADGRVSGLVECASANSETRVAGWPVGLSCSEAGVVLRPPSHWERPGCALAQSSPNLT